MSEADRPALEIMSLEQYQLYVRSLPRRRRARMRWCLATMKLRLVVFSVRHPALARARRGR